MKQLIVALFASTLAACTSLSETPTFQQLDWNPPQLSAVNCPDLSGRFIAPSPNIYDQIFPRPAFSKGLFANSQIYQRDKALEIIITIQSRPNGVSIRADNGRNHVETFTPYDGVKFGCHNGMIVSRYIGGRYGGAESGKCIAISYGEYFTYLNADGDALVGHTARERCGTFGSLANLSPGKEMVARPVVFRRAR